MKLLLISPVAKSKLLGKNLAFNIPFMSLPVLAAHTSLDVEITIIDERVQPINFNQAYDLVGITVMTPLAPRAYEIADQFRARGVKVVLGGMHVSALPQEALAHADSVVVGEAEDVWPRLLADFKANTLKSTYQSEKHTDLTKLLAPRRELLARQRYVPVEFIETTRGCPFGCSFCAVTNFFGGSYRNRPIEQVIDEISKFDSPQKRFSIKNVVFFVDDNIIGFRSHAKELFEKIKPFKLNWLGQASTNLAKDDELIKLAKDSGCMGLFMGFESLSQGVLKTYGKSVNRVNEYFDIIQKIQGQGIGLMGSFVFGFDQDTPEMFAGYKKFIDQAKLASVYLGILTPYPGTKLYQELKAQNRLTDNDWSHYDTSHVVYRPQGMTAQQLKQGYLWTLKQTYSLLSIFRRLKNTKVYKPFFWPMNLGLNLTINRLTKTQE